VVCLAPRAREDSVRPRRLSGVVVRPLNFTVRRPLHATTSASGLHAPVDPPARRHRRLHCGTSGFAHCILAGRNSRSCACGESHQDAQAFFATRGLELHCCMSGPDIEHAYSATERNIGRFGWIEYSALIVVDVSSDQRVSRVRVLRTGVGL
jgi:hypothetical protein